MRGSLITFEGIDGSGKQTQIDSLLEELSKTSTPTIVFTYPDLAGRYAEQISSILNKDQHLSPRQEFNIFAKDIEKDAKAITKLANSNNIVICDRFIYSTICYQSARAGGLEHKQFTLTQAKKQAKKLKLAKPDLVILLDLPAEIGLKRKLKQKTRQHAQLHSFEKDAKFLSQVRENYLQLAREKFHTNWLVLDATKKPNQLRKHIYTYINSITK